MNQLDQHTIRGISLLIFGIGVIIADLVGNALASRHDERLKQLRKEHRGSNER